MLKFWSGADQTTPKPAQNGDRPNPFDFASNLHHHLLATDSPSSPGAIPDISADLTPLGALPPPNANFAAATTSLSLHAPDFNIMQPPKPKNKVPAQQQPQISGPSKGQIHVKLIQARGLNVPSLQARPYVVVQFEQNEFVSRDPTDESDKEVKGVATNLSRNSSSNALSALTAIGFRASVDLSKRNGAVTPNGNAHLSSSPISLLLPAKSPPKSRSLLGCSRSAHNPVWKHEVSFDVTSEESTLTCNIYDRGDGGYHAFLGTVQIKPSLIHDLTVDHWYKVRPVENEHVTGDMRVQITYEADKTRRALTPRDFEFLKLIGRGTFGKVYQVRKKNTKRIYAMKVLSKKEIVARKEIAHTIGERKILQRSLESPFLVGLKFSFQTDSDLYLVTDFKSGGELFWHLQKETRFTEDRAKFYIAELILALEHLHKYNIVYRDLKPENILLDATGHVALCDFGLSKPDLRSDELTNTFCGTTEYLAPEILLDEKGYSKMVDFWSLGVLLFEMCCGWSPFYAEDTDQMYRNICFGKIRFPRGVFTEIGKQFVKGLLNRNPKHRLGSQEDAAELKEHPFFKSIDWAALVQKQVTPPFKPVVESDESVSNFDPEFTTTNLNDSGVGDYLDDNDPSEEWVSRSVRDANGVGLSHMPNGPLGSDWRGRAMNGLSSSSQGIEISRRNGVSSNSGAKPNGAEDIGTTRGLSPPLTSSIQENFRGFTYSGEDAGSLISQAIGKLQGDSEGAVEEEEIQEPTTEDEVEDHSAPAGRYAKQRRRKTDGIEDDDF